MGKYTIETDGITADSIQGYLGFPIEICGKRTWVKTDMELTPYTEPDLGRVRKEAYKIGYEKGYRDGVNRIGDAEDKIRKEAYADGYNAGFGRKIDASYQEGLSDAWKAASEIAVIPYDEVEKIFGATGWHIFMKCTASEAIEKIRQYEQEQEEIKVGDEVIRHYKNEFMEGDDAPSIFLSEEDGHFRCLAFNGRSIMIAEYPKNQYRKTGRHFPEIAEVLAKMREE